jgi:alkylation response protein AidB-like acyl-CoA dehydrogenase
MAMMVEPVLSDQLLETLRSRAATYDRENRFFQEDFDDLRDAGYLQMALPREFGGAGMTLAEVARETQRLAQYAPATALGLNMHTYWVGVAADVWRSGDRSLEWMLRDAAEGEVFAAGHAESNNESSLFMSGVNAEPVSGGYRITGRKAFGSLSPVWTRLGLHAMDATDPAAPKIVHLFMPRTTPGYSIVETWDVMGMRATRSDDTIIDGAIIPEQYVARVLPAGLAGADYFVLTIFAWALTGFSSVYYGLARRALNLIVAQMQEKRSLGLTRSMANHPEVQHQVAEMRIDLEAIGAHVERVARDWSDGVQHSDWPVKIVAAKYSAVEGAWRIVDRAMDVSGGFGMFKKSELERLFRDARAGRFHPANSSLTHEIVGKLVLGVDPDALPRWG